MLSKGADANAPGGGPEAVTPMHDAGFNGHFEIVSKLLQHGGDPNKVSGRVSGSGRVCFREETWIRFFLCLLMRLDFKLMSFAQSSANIFLPLVKCPDRYVRRRKPPQN